MKYGSVCSGIEAASVAWRSLGWRAEFVSEIDPFPCAVLKHHHTATPNFGNITKFQEWPDAVIDILVGGTPCQSFSVAGLRKGMADPRGNLALTYLAISNRYRPKWLVWENVPGVLSSNGGRDFGSILGGMAELGYGFAYRILDAQYFGVAQRRRRVFVVGYLGDWRRAAAVLFERHSLQGHPSPSRKTREKVAPTISARTKGGGGLGTDFDCSGGLVESVHSDSEAYIPVPHADISPAIKARDGKEASSDGDGDGSILVPMLAFSAQDNGRDATEGITPTMRQGGNGGGVQIAVAFTPMQVRRLTPIECERLQGFPDDYTQVPYRNKPAADGPRYKALGNSMAVPVMTWLGKRIAETEEITT